MKVAREVCAVDAWPNGEVKGDTSIAACSARVLRAATLHLRPFPFVFFCVYKAYGGTIEELEDAQLQLQTLLSMRHVTPFRDIVQVGTLNCRFLWN